MIVPFITYGPRNQNVNDTLFYPPCSSSEATGPRCCGAIIFLEVSDGFADDTTMDSDLRESTLNLMSFSLIQSKGHRDAPNTFIGSEPLAGFAFKSHSTCFMISFWLTQFDKMSNKSILICMKLDAGFLSFLSVLLDGYNNCMNHF